MISRVPISPGLKEIRARVYKTLNLYVILQTQAKSLRRSAEAQKPRADPIQATYDVAGAERREACESLRVAGGSKARGAEPIQATYDVAGAVRHEG